MSVFYEIGRACSRQEKSAAFFRFQNGNAVRADLPDQTEQLRGVLGQKRPNMPPTSLRDLIHGQIDKPQYKFNPETGRIDMSGSFGVHPLLQQHLDQLKQQNKMFSDMDPGFAQILGLAPKSPTPPPAPAKTPSVVRNAFGPLHMNDYRRVPNLMLPSTI